MAHSDDEFCYLCGIVIPGVSLPVISSCYFLSYHRLHVFFLFPGWSGGMQGVPKGAEIYLLWVWPG